MNEDYFQQDWYKQFAKRVLNEIIIKFENVEKRKLSDDEFNEIYEDYRDSGLALDDNMKARKFK